MENRHSQLELRPLDAPGADRTIVIVWRKAAAAPEAYAALARVAADALDARQLAQRQKARTSRRRH